MRPRSKAFAHAGLFALAVASLTTTATASQPDFPDAPTELHCAWKLEPVGPGDIPGVTEAVSVPLGCFTSASEAIFAGTGGAVQVPEELAEDRLTQEILDQFGAQTASSFLIGREYEQHQLRELDLRSLRPRAMHQQQRMGGWVRRRRAERQVRVRERVLELQLELQVGALSVPGCSARMPPQLQHLRCPEEQGSPLSSGSDSGWARSYCPR